MKKQFAVIAAIVFASVSLVHAQDASEDATAIPESPEQEAVEPSEDVIIEEPSGAQPDIEVPAPSPTPPDFETTPVDPTAGAPGLDESDTNAITVTVSQSFTNAQNAITVVGSVSSEEEKQKVEQALQEALPDKEINNRLTVSAQQITEPSGAEPSDEESELDDQEDDALEDDALEDEEETDVEREFEIQDQNNQSLP